MGKPSTDSQRHARILVLHHEPATANTLDAVPR